MAITRIFYPSGILKAIGQLKNGKKQGVWTFYDQDGRKTVESTFCDDKDDGPCTQWYENGQKEEDGYYSKGEYYVTNFWLEDGRQLLSAGNGKTVKKFGALDGDIYEQYYSDGVFLGEKKIAGIQYGKFTPDDDRNGS